MLKNRALTQLSGDIVDSPTVELLPIFLNWSAASFR